jgi:predicted transcriptional regulator
MPTVDALVDVDEVYRLLSAGNSGVVVTRVGEIVGIVTRIDLIDFWDDPLERDYSQPTKSAAFAS